MPPRSPDSARRAGPRGQSSAASQRGEAAAPFRPMCGGVRPVHAPPLPRRPHRHPVRPPRGQHARCDNIPNGLRPPTSDLGPPTSDSRLPTLDLGPWTPVAAAPSPDGRWPGRTRRSSRTRVAVPATPLVLLPDGGRGSAHSLSLGFRLRLVATVATAAHPSSARRDSRTESGWVAPSLTLLRPRAARPNARLPGHAPTTRIPGATLFQPGFSTLAAGTTSPCARLRSVCRPPQRRRPLRLWRQRRRLLRRLLHPHSTAGARRSTPPPAAAAAATLVAATVAAAVTRATVARAIAAFDGCSQRITSQRPCDARSHVLIPVIPQIPCCHPRCLPLPPRDPDRDRDRDRYPPPSARPHGHGDDRRCPTAVPVPTSTTASTSTAPRWAGRRPRQPSKAPADWLRIAADRCGAVALPAWRSHSRSPSPPPFTFFTWQHWQPYAIPTLPYPPIAAPRPALSAAGPTRTYPFLSVGGMPGTLNAMTPWAPVPAIDPADPHDGSPPAWPLSMSPAAPSPALAAAATAADGAAAGLLPSAGSVHGFFPPPPGGRDHRSAPTAPWHPGAPALHVAATGSHAVQPPCRRSPAHRRAPAPAAHDPRDAYAPPQDLHPGRPRHGGPSRGPPSHSSGHGPAYASGSDAAGLGGFLQVSADRGGDGGGGGGDGGSDAPAIAAAAPCGLFPPPTATAATNAFLEHLGGVTVSAAPHPALSPSRAHPYDVRDPAGRLDATRPRPLEALLLGVAAVADTAATAASTPSAAARAKAGMPTPTPRGLAMTVLPSALPLGVAPAAGPAVPPRPSTAPPEKRFYVQKACVHCKNAHVACDTQRPCQRCVRLGRSETCEDATRKKRGRPRIPDRHLKPAKRRSKPRKAGAGLAVPAMAAALTPVSVSGDPDHVALPGPSVGSMHQAAPPAALLSTPAISLLSLRDAEPYGPIGDTDRRGGGRSGDGGHGLAGHGHVGGGMTDQRADNARAHQLSRAASSDTSLGPSLAVATANAAATLVQQASAGSTPTHAVRLMETSLQTPPKPPNAAAAAAAATATAAVVSGMSHATASGIPMAMPMPLPSTPPNMQRPPYASQRVSLLSHMIPHIPTGEAWPTSMVSQPDAPHSSASLAASYATLHPSSQQLHPLQQQDYHHHHQQQQQQQPLDTASFVSWLTTYDSPSRLDSEAIDAKWPQLVPKEVSHAAERLGHQGYDAALSAAPLQFAHPRPPASYAPMRLGYPYGPTGHLPSQPPPAPPPQPHVYHATATPTPAPTASWYAYDHNYGHVPSHHSLPTVVPGYLTPQQPQPHQLTHPYAAIASQTHAHAHAPASAAAAAAHAPMALPVDLDLRMPLPLEIGGVVPHHHAVGHGGSLVMRGAGGMGSTRMAPPPLAAAPVALGGGHGHGGPDGGVSAMHVAAGAALPLALSDLGVGLPVGSGIDFPSAAAQADAIRQRRAHANSYRHQGP
ncbi:hypothetical protein CXG81DRAFT_19607 [Caulochytrium protostelioides]|uniref:Zn(2)-C6 fungal-type domain-containing protein n=1 Tax=Caulochytrium protostelioides TaxID=1555241 RepID=A0A4P9X5N4_9FUNG|nr:hypothetical protein CXG81DRAFT_19607 [Caulochytrium protostelioides]|eukprot:RKP00422.1 hypothetical protein CXG81DRAFT_19607 [Caulochytrium protostelioides]